MEDFINKRIKELESQIKEDDQVRERLMAEIRNLTNSLESLNTRISNSKAILNELKNLKSKTKKEDS